MLQRDLGPETRGSVHPARASVQPVRVLVPVVVVVRSGLRRGSRRPERLAMACITTRAWFEFRSGLLQRDKVLATTDGHYCYRARTRQQNGDEGPAPAGEAWRYHCRISVSSLVGRGSVASL